jgi:hypothetical protein
MTDTFYIKLVTGEEILGIATVDDRLTTIEHPLRLEFNETEEGKKYIYLTRYAPFNDQAAVCVRNEMVVHLSPVKPEVHDYYHRSLEYCRIQADKNFLSGILEATDYIQELNEEAETPRVKKAKDEEADDVIMRVIAQVIGCANTIH